MPILNLGQLMSIGTTFAGGRTDLPVSEASLYVNLAYEQVSVVAGAAHIPKEALAESSTTSGGNRVALPADFEFPIALTLFQGSTSTATSSRVTTEVPLRLRDTAFLDAQPDQFVSGVPAYYTWYATWLELFPSPNSAYSLQLRYSAQQATLVASTDTPVLGARWHQAIAWKTVEVMEGARGNSEGELLARNRYLNHVSTLQTDQGLRQQDRRSMTVRFGGGSWSRPRRLD